MLKLFPEKYKQYVTKYNIYSVVLATLLIIVGFAGFLFFLFDAASFPKATRFTLVILNFLVIIAGFVMLLIVRYLVSARHQKLLKDTYSENLAATSNPDARARLLESFVHNKYDYHNSGRMGLEQTFFVTGLIVVTTYILDAIILGLFLAIPLTIASGIIWFAAWLRKGDFIKITADGLSYSLRGESGFAPWNSIKEIQHVRKIGYLIKTNTITINVNYEIEPADAPLPGILRRFLFDYRYAKELIDQILKIAPHIPHKKWDLE